MAQQQSARAVCAEPRVQPTTKQNKQEGSAHWRHAGISMKIHKFLCFAAGEPPWPLGFFICSGVEAGMDEWILKGMRLRRTDRKPPAECRSWQWERWGRSAAVASASERFPQKGSKLGQRRVSAASKYAPEEGGSPLSRQTIHADVRSLLCTWCGQAYSHTVPTPFTGAFAF